jgi:hypothetical protein
MAKASAKVKGEMPGRGTEAKKTGEAWASEAGSKIDSAVRSLPFPYPYPLPHTIPCNFMPGCAISPFLHYIMRLDFTNIVLTDRESPR